MGARAACSWCARGVIHLMGLCASPCGRAHLSGHQSLHTASGRPGVTLGVSRTVRIVGPAPLAGGPLRGRHRGADIGCQPAPWCSVRAGPGGDDQSSWALGGARRETSSLAIGVRGRLRTRVQRRSCGATRGRPPGLEAFWVSHRPLRAALHRARSCSICPAPAWCSCGIALQPPGETPGPGSARQRRPCARRAEPVSGGRRRQAVGAIAGPFRRRAAVQRARSKGCPVRMTMKISGTSFRATAHRAAVLPCPFRRSAS